MKKNHFRLLYIFLTILLATQGYSQYGDLLQSTGTVPMDFRSTYFEKMEEYDYRTVEQTDLFLEFTQKEMKASSTFITDKVLKSGGIIYGGEVVDYLEDVLDEVLKDDPDLRSSIRIYISKSTEVNAFMTPGGIMIVNAGLLTQLENEAQLAFILAHELIHFREKHGVDYTLHKTKELRAGREQSNLLTYSREQEFEADKKGFEEYLLQTDYDLQEAIRAMDVLLYGYLPFDEIPFEKEFLERQGIKLPEIYFPVEINNITAFEDYDDEKSSHPNIKKRKEALREKAELISSDEKREFIVSQPRFSQIQKKVRKEICVQNLIQCNYPKALYNSYLMSKVYPGDDWYNAITAYSLYALSVYKNDEELEGVIGEYEKNVEGESFGLYYFLDKISSLELTTLAVSFTYDLHRKDTSHIFYKKLYDRSLQELVFYHGKGPDDFSHTAPDSVTDTIEDEEGKPLSKIDKIHQGKAETKRSFYYYAFVDMFESKPFDDDFTNMARECEKFSLRKESFQKRTDPEIRFEPKGVEPNSKVIIIDPQFFQFRPDDVTPLDYKKSEKQRQNLVNILKTFPSLGPVEIDLLTFEDIDPQNNKTFNDMIHLHEWIAEKSGQPHDYMYSSQAERAKVLASEYGTPYFAFMTVSSSRDANIVGKLGTSLLSTLLIYMTPAAQIWPFLQNNSETYYEFIVFDIERGVLAFRETIMKADGDHTDTMTITIQELISKMDEQ